MAPPSLPPASPRQKPLLGFIQAIPYVLAVVTTSYALILVFGEMWFGFKNSTIVHTLFVVSSMCLVSGIIAATINKGKEIIGYSISSAAAPTFLFLLMIVGCIEDIQKERSFETLTKNWLLLLIPPAIFFSQTIPIFITRKFTR